MVPKCALSFEPWRGEPCGSDYGGKMFVEVNGECLFAELGILRLLARTGWWGVWVDTYRRRYRQVMPHVADGSRVLPEPHSTLFNNIAIASGRPWSGSWDVFAWRATDCAFVESKRHRRDSMRPSQYAWLAAALTVGVTLEQFLVVEWDLV
jgi:hypothetical protein